MRQAGQAALAGGPVARRQVEQHLLDIGRLQPLGDIMRRPVVGKEVFDALKPGAAASRKRRENASVNKKLRLAANFGMARQSVGGLSV
jgi:hypothetical protein